MIIWVLYNSNWYVIVSDQWSTTDLKGNPLYFFITVFDRLVIIWVVEDRNEEVVMTSQGASTELRGDQCFMD